MRVSTLTEAAYRLLRRGALVDGPVKLLDAPGLGRRAGHVRAGRQGLGAGGDERGVHEEQGLLRDGGRGPLRRTLERLLGG